MRNAPPNLQVVFPHGVPKGISETVIPQHPDGVVQSMRPGDGALLVDMMTKEVKEYAEE